MKNKKQKIPDEALGKFCIIGGGIMVILPLIVSRLDFGQRCSAAAAGFMGLSWGLKEVAAAKKWKQKYGEPNLAEQTDLKKRHSISNSNLPLFILSIAALMLLGLIFVMLICH